MTELIMLNEKMCLIIFTWGVHLILSLVFYRAHDKTHS